MDPDEAARAKPTPYRSFDDKPTHDKYNRFEAKPTHNVNNGVDEKATQKPP